MPAKPKSRRSSQADNRLKRILIIVAAVAVIGFGGLWLTHTIFKPKPQNEVLQRALADQFGGDFDMIIANVPSRSGRYPGAVMAVSTKGSELLVRKEERPDSVPETSGSINGARLTGGNTVWQLAGREFGARLAGEGSASVMIELQDIRIFEREAGELAADLRGDGRVSRARATGQPVVVITKSYEAVPVITIRQSSAAKAEDWAKLKNDLTKAKGEVSADNSVVFRSSEPQVVAYETQEVKFIAGNFSGGESKLELKRSPVDVDGSAMASPEDFGGKAGGGDVAFAVIASPRYSNPNFGDLPAAETSADLVDGLFRTMGAKPLDTGLDRSAPLTADTFTAARKKIFDAVKKLKPRAFVLYYSGHAVSGTAGAHYLVMGNYNGKLADDLKETSPFFPTGDPSSPLTGSNIEDIAKAIAAAGQKLATSWPGLVAVADLYRELTETGVPFAIIVDGCYEAAAMSQLRDELQLTPWGDYFGPDDGGPREIQKYQRALRTYGEAPYLRSTNPVIFAAKPGTVAPVVRHPLYETDLLGGVGPLAAKLTGTYLYALENQESLSLGPLLRRITDFAGTGELDVKGSISWSDFSALREVPMMQFDGNSNEE